VRVPVRSDGEVGIDPVLCSAQPQLLQAGDLRLGEGLVGELPERRPPPQRKRVAHRSACSLRALGGELLSPLREQRLEAIEVELARR
jgi:hypothetical protein